MVLVVQLKAPKYQKIKHLRNDVWQGGERGIEENKEVESRIFITGQ